MGRKPLDVHIRLKRQEEKILQLTKELEEAKDEYQKLLEEQEEADKKKLIEAFRKSKRSLDQCH